MKIEKLVRDFAGRYDLEEVPDKINEIIEVLNKSFITDEPDIFYGKTLSVDEIINGSIVLTDITCDRLTPYPNEHIIDSSSLTIKGHIFDDMCAKTEPNPWMDKKCPHCGESYYSPGVSYTTAVYYTPIYKDGVNINPDRNKCTSTYHCHACGKDWEETI